MPYHTPNHNQDALPMNSFLTPLTQGTVIDFSHEFELDLILTRAISYYPSSLDPQLLQIAVEFEPRLQSSAGMYYPRYRIIKLHPGLRTATRLEFIQTFLHEVAHAMQHLSKGWTDHSTSWVEMMHHLGQEPKICHNISSCQTRFTAVKAGITAENLGL